MQTRIIEQCDVAEWARMREQLWPEQRAEHEREIAVFFAGHRRDPAEVILAIGDEGQPIGFAEVTLRSHAEGCSTTPVAYLEGWFVEAEYRGRGVGTMLMTAVEDWARAQGCTELASDTEWHNTASQAAHRALGFTEVDRIVCFKKELSSPEQARSKTE